MMRRSYVTLSSVLAAVALGTMAHACVEPTPVQVAPGIWLIPGFEGRTELCVELGAVFPTTVAHQCSCGAGLGSLQNPIPPGVSMNGAKIGVIDVSGTPTFTPIPQFNVLAPDGPATSGFQQGAGQPGLGAPLPGSTWFGFGATVGAVTPPPLGPNKKYVACFNVSGATPAQLMSLPIQFAGGLGDPSDPFAPLFDPSNPHSAKYGGVANAGPPCAMELCTFTPDRFGNLPPDRMQVVAMYDGDGSPTLTIGLSNPATGECCDIVISGLNNTDVATHEFDMNGFEPTGTFTVSGATPNGSIDGVAFGLYSRAVDGERWLLRSRSFQPGTGAASPNFVGGWPIAWSEATWDSKLVGITGPCGCGCVGFDLLVARRQAQLTLSGAQLLLNGTWVIATGRVPGDLNGDGCVNGADLGTVLGAWGGVCCP